MSGKEKMLFGKYKGNTIDSILENNPSYLVWLDENTAFKVPNKQLNEARKYCFQDNWPDLECLIGDWGDRY